MGVQRKLNLDKIGAFASAACAVHCLLTGVALGVLSILGLGFIGSTITDIVFLCVTLSVASLAIFTGIRRHRSFIPAGIFLVGVTAIVLSHFVFGNVGSGGPETILTTILSVAGGCCLVMFHVVNLRMQRHGHNHSPSRDYQPSQSTESALFQDTPNS